MDRRTYNLRHKPCRQHSPLWGKHIGINWPSDTPVCYQVHIFERLLMIHFFVDVLLTFFSLHFRDHTLWFCTVPLKRVIYNSDELSVSHYIIPPVLLWLICARWLWEWANLWTTTRYEAGCWWLSDCVWYGTWHIQDQRGHWYMNYSRFLYILNVQYIYCNSDIVCIIPLLSSSIWLSGG